MAKEKEEKVVAPEEHAVKTEQEKLKEMLRDEAQRTAAKTQATKVYMVMSGEQDLSNAGEKVFTETDICHCTNLSHKNARKFMDVLHLFGLIELQSNNKFKFHFEERDQIDVIMLGISSLVSILKTDMERFNARIEKADIPESEKQERRDAIKKLFSSFAE